MTSSAIPAGEAAGGTRALRVAGADGAALRPLIAALREEMGVAGGFPPAAEAAAAAAARRGPRPDAARADRTALDLVTIDPPGSRDLDQAVHVARRPGGFTVNYAIADVTAFVVPGDPVDAEAHARGETLYGAGGSIPLHPRALSEGAASLLEGEDRPAALWTLEVDDDGAIGAARVERAMVRSRTRLDYAAADALAARADAPGGLRHLRALGEALRAREVVRGGVSLPMPEQVVEVAGGRWSLAFRRMRDIERWNAQVSLATGMAAARIMAGAGLGILRSLPPAPAEEHRRLRRAALALGIAWPEGESYPDMVHRLDPSRPADAAMLAASGRMLRGSGYAVVRGGEAPADAAHAGLAAHYAHVTAPLRRLVDRYGLEICLAACAGRPVPEWVAAGLDALPDIMRASGRRAGAYEGAVLNLVEAVALRPHIGRRFAGAVVERDARRPERGVVVIGEPAVEARIDGDGPLPLGEAVDAELVHADPATRTVRFALAAGAGAVRPGP